MHSNVPITTLDDLILVAVVQGMVSSGYRNPQELAKEAFEIVDAINAERKERASSRSRYPKKPKKE